MYIETIRNRNSPPAVLLRQSYRVGAKVRKKTLANLTHWPMDKVKGLRTLLKGGIAVEDPRQLFHVTRNLPHGHVAAVLGLVGKLGLDTMIASKRCRERDLVLAMIGQRVLFPSSKLATVRHWHTTTLAEELGTDDADENELYAVLDWLRKRQPAIEKKLARRHLADGDQVLYDVSSSYYEGRCCPLAEYGHNRDGKKGRQIIVYGVLADAAGRPLAVQVYPGNTGDPTTLPDQVEKLREKFGLGRVVLVGDRGMLTQTRLETLRDYPGLGWISALRSRAIGTLLADGHLRRSLFDVTQLAEISSPDFPGERLIACYNPLLAEERHRKRQALLAATETQLAKLAAQAARRSAQPLSEADIGLKAGRVINRHKMAKHFELTIAAGSFAWQRRADSIRQEEQLDGIYIIRTSEPAERLDAADTVRSYKDLSQVERAFRGLKSDLQVRPIYLRSEEHVRAHIFLCLLAYYVEWHLREAWAPLLFADEELPQRRGQRAPVPPAEPSASARRKKASKRTPTGFPAHSFRTLLEELGTQCRNTCTAAYDPESPSFQEVTEPTPLQSEAFSLLGL